MSAAESSPPAHVFRAKHSVEARRKMATKVARDYPDRVPVILDVARGVELNKYKFLVPRAYTVGAFLTNLRRSVTSAVEATDALYLLWGFHNPVLVPTSSTLAAVHSRLQDEDGMLYCHVARESTFG